MRPQLGSENWHYSGFLSSLVTSHDQSVIAGGAAELVIWEASSGKPLQRLERASHYAVLQLVFSLDDMLLALGDVTGVELWDWRAGRRLCRLEGESRAIWAEGKGFSAAVSTPEELRIILLPEEKELYRLSGFFQGVALSSSFLAVFQDATPGQITLYTRPALKIHCLLQGSASFSYEKEEHGMWEELYSTTVTDPARPRVLAFSPDGSRLASAGNEPVVRIWEPVSGQCLKEIPTGLQNVAELCWSVDGRLGLVRGSLPAALWSNNQLEILPSTSAIGFFHKKVLLCHYYAVSFYQDGCEQFFEEDGGDTQKSMAVFEQILIIRGSRFLYAWSLKDGAMLWKLPASNCSYAPLVFDNTGTGWTPVFAKKGDGWSLCQISAEHGLLPGRIAPIPTLTWSLSLSPTKMLAVAGYQHSVSIWSGEQQLATLENREPHAVVLMESGAVVAEKDGSISCFKWEGSPSGSIAPFKTITPQSKGTGQAPNDEAHCLVVMGSQAVSSWNDVLRVWDLEEGRERLASPCTGLHGKGLCVGFKNGKAWGVVAGARKRRNKDGSLLWFWSEEKGVVELNWWPVSYWWMGACAVRVEGVLWVGEPDGVIRGYDMKLS
jgi:WD40 repeat protein